MSKKKLLKNLILMSLIMCLIYPIVGCGNSNKELYMGDFSETESQLESADVERTLVEYETKSLEAENIYVYICGAVNNPGVYELKAGSRLYEAVDMAGGISDDADERYINMARVLTDGEQVVVYTVSEAQTIKEEEAAAIIESKIQEEKSGLVNINTADIAELSTLSGIGASRAQAIIDYRERNGAFNSIEDIKNVDGIKDGLFSKIKDKITV
jgi:competence protein ComEA